MEKDEIAHFEQFHFFHNVFYAIRILKATFQFSSAASLNLGLSQNGASIMEWVEIEPED